MMDYDELFKARLILPRLGEISLSALIVAIISGVALIPGYFLTPEPFDNVTRLVSSGIIGRFLHGCHSYAGDIFLLALLLHTIEYLFKKADLGYTWRSWTWMTVLLLGSILLVFSGFLSIGSLESRQAGEIFRSLMEQAGPVGVFFYRMLFGVATETSIFVLLAHHAASFSILTIILTYLHIQRLRADTYAFYYTLLLIALLAILVPASVGTSPEAVLPVIKGPWYFRGLQQMLIYVPRVMAGLVAPLLMIVGFWLLPVAGRARRLIVTLLGVFSLYYIVEGIRLTLKGSPW